MMSADHASHVHNPFDELAVGWALHALEPEDEAVFVAHLSGCERCAVTVAETREVMSAMAVDLPQPEPSEGLLGRIRVAVDQTEQLPPPVASTVEPPRAVPASRRAPEPQQGWRGVLPVGLVAAALAAIVGLGLWNVVLASDRDKLQATVAEQNAVMNGLLAPGRATIAPMEEHGKAVATVVARGDEVAVLVQGLSENDTKSNTYVLWAMDGTPQALGTFDVTSSRIVLKTVGSASTGFDQYRAYGISLEPGRKAPSLPTGVVATGQVTS